jgi:predicted ATPase
MLPQQITSVKIAGYKSIQNAELPLRRVNVLIGPNGSGKTNLASFFRMLRFLAQGELQSFIGRAGGGNMLLYNGAKQTRQIEARLSVETITGMAEYAPQLVYSSGDTLLLDSETVSRRQTDDPDNRDISVNAGTLRESRFAEAALAGHGAGLSIFRLLQQCRAYHFHDTTPEAPIRQHCDINDNKVLHEDGRNLTAVLYKLQETQPAFYQLIVRTVRLVAPFFQTFSLAPNALNRNTIALRWRQSGVDEDFSCHQLSDGTLRFIALATLLLQPRDDRPPLVFIDEPELGLHPYALGVLGGLIHRASEGMQIVAATQSPGLLDAFAPADIIVVERAREATVFRRLAPEPLQEWLEEYKLSELWEKNVLGGRPAR